MTTKQGLLVVISGPSGVGKDTLIKSLLHLDHNLVYSVSGTTRQPRPREVPDQNYTFLTRDQFEDLVNKGAFLEHATYNGNLYGTFRDRVERARNEGRDIVLKIEVQGAEQVREKMPEGVFIFLAPPSVDELVRRQIKRGTESVDDMEARRKIAEIEMQFASKYDHVVVNDDIERAAQEVLAIIDDARRREGQT